MDRGDGGWEGVVFWSFSRPSSRSDGAVYVVSISSWNGDATSVPCAIGFATLDATEHHISFHTDIPQCFRADKDSNVGYMIFVLSLSHPRRLIYFERIHSQKPTDFSSHLPLPLCLLLILPTCPATKTARTLLHISNLSCSNLVKYSSTTILSTPSIQVLTPHLTNLGRWYVFPSGVSEDHHMYLVDKIFWFS